MTRRLRLAHVLERAEARRWRRFKAWTPGRQPAQRVLMEQAQDLIWKLIEAMRCEP